MDKFSNLSEAGIVPEFFVGEVRFSFEGHPFVVLRHSSTHEVAQKALSELDGREEFMGYWGALVDSLRRGGG